MPQTGNRITNNRGSGAELDTVLGTQVLGNLVTGNDTYRISLYVASASLLKGNTVEGSSEAGISVSASSDNHFKKNGSSNSEAGFSILSGTGNVLLGNVANENLSRESSRPSPS